MNPAADAAGAARYEDRVARIPSQHDHFVTAEERGHGVARQNFSLLQIGDRVKGQRAGDAGDRIKIDIFDITIPCQQTFDLLVAQWSWTSSLWLTSQTERPGDVVAQRHFP